MNFLQRNLFIKLRSENFGTDEELEPMTTFKMQKIAKMMKNLSDIPYETECKESLYSYMD